MSWRWVAGAAALAAFAALLLHAQLPSLSAGPDNEFQALYAGARGETQGALDGQAALRPPALGLLLWPLAQLPYPSAAVLWLVLSAWAAAGFVALWRPGSASANLCGVALSAPLFLALCQGRETALLLLALALSAWAVRRGREFLGGFWLGLCVLAPQTWLLAPLVPLVQLRRRLGLGMLAGAGAVAAVSFAAAPADWPLDTLGAILQRSYAMEAWTEPTLRSVVLSNGADFRLWPAAVCLAAALTILIVSRVSYPLALGAAFAGGLLVSPFAELADAALLLPIALAVLAQGRTRMLRAAALAALCPLLYWPAADYAPLAVVLVALTLLMFTAAESLALTGAGAGLRLASYGRAGGEQTVRGPAHSA